MEREFDIVVSCGEGTMLYLGSTDLNDEPPHDALDGYEDDPRLIIIMMAPSQKEPDNGKA